jgi:uncharacterized OB-fold protein
MSVGAVDRDPATAEFFDGTAAGVFLLRRCRVDGTWGEPQTVQCTTCGSTDLGWEPAAGAATVVSWSVVHGRPREDGSVARTILVVAQFDEGPWWWSRLVGADPDAVSTGAALRVDVERRDGHEAVPVFRLAN